MNGGNMAEFVAFKDELPEELIRYAIDEACAANKRTWGYTRAILTRFRDNGFKTVGEAKAAKPVKTGQNYTSERDYVPQHMRYKQRPSTDYTYGKFSYSDPTKNLD